MKPRPKEHEDDPPQKRPEKKSTVVEQYGALQPMISRTTAVLAILWAFLTAVHTATAVPSITAQPIQSQVATTGTCITFSVVASGNGALSYQWFRNNRPVTGGTGSSLTLSSVQYPDQGAYTATVTDSTGTVTSSVGFLNVMLPLNGLVAWGDNIEGQATIPTGMNSVVAVAAGGNESLALQSDGTVVAWGDNSAGQATVPSGLNGVAAIAVGYTHSLALRSDGTVVAWGDNSAGQTTVPAGLSGVVAIAAGGNEFTGEDHSLALKADGTVIAWGSNDSGQTTIPTGLSGVVAIAAGGSQSVALKADGTVVAWGSQTTVPSGLSSVIGIAAGEGQILALQSDGTVVGWGGNLYGQASVPTGLNNVTAVATCGLHSLALKSDGTVVAWGNNYYGGIPTGLSGVAAIAAGEWHNIALVPTFVPVITEQPSSRIVSPGMPMTLSALATGNFLSYQWQKNGAPVSGGTGATLTINSISAGDIGDYTVAVSNSAGSVMSSVATISFVGTPVPSQQIVASGSNVTFSLSATSSAAVSYQWYHNNIPIAGGTGASLTLSNVQYSDRGAYSVAVADSTGTAFSNPGFINVLMPNSYSVAVLWGYYEAQADVPAGLCGVVAVASGSDHNLALKLDGTLVAWGDNSAGQCSVPAGLTGVVAVAAGYMHSLSLKSDGTVVAWGDNSRGQCNVPAGLCGVVAIAAGGWGCIALKSDGTVVAWGLDNNVPGGLNGVVAIAAGFTHSLALKSDGTVVAWGDDYNGETVVPSGLNNVAGIAAGYEFSLALKSDGTVVAWGVNWRGESSVPSGLNNVVAVAAAYYHGLALQADGTVVAWGDQSGVAQLPGALAVSTGGVESLALVPLYFPTITQQPVEQTVSPWTSATFSVAASGGLLSYQWQKDGVAIDGATGSTLTVGSPYFPDLGAYSVVVSNALGAATSSSAALSFFGPAITSQPAASQVAASGSNATFSVVASGSGTVSYQWYHNNVPITGGTGSVLNLGSVGYADRGAYTVNATDATGTLTSEAGFLNVVTPSMVVGWGDDSFGQTAVPSGLSTAVAIAAGPTYCLALKADGTVVAWGDNSQGQAAVPAGLTGVVAIAAGSDHGVALKSDGTVVEWGGGDNGSEIPAGLNGVVAIAAGSGYTLALKSDGTVVEWGNYDYVEYNGPVPTGLNGVVAIVAAGGQNLALKSDGTVAGWGTNCAGLASPVPAGLAGVVGLATAASSSFALKSDGTVVGWGWDFFGVDDTPPEIPSDLSGVIAISAASSLSYLGESHFVALKADGILVTCGDNDSGQNTVPVGLSGIVAVGAGGDYTLALAKVSSPVITQQPSRQWVTLGGSATFSVAATGYALSYQWEKDGVAIASATSASLTVSASSSADAAGAYTVVVSNEQGTVTSNVATLFYNAVGMTPTQQVALSGSVATFSVNVTSSGPLNYQWYHDGVAITGGTSSSLTLANVQYDDRGAYIVTVTDSLGSVTSNAGFLNVLLQQPVGVFSWGNQSPDAVVSAGVVAISGGGNLKSDGTVDSFYAPAGLNSVVGIAALDEHGVALKSDGTVVAWGWWTDYDDGENTAPPELSNMVAVATGNDHCLALKSDGTVVAWGDDYYGQTSVPTGLSAVIAIAAGGYHSLTLKSDGTVVAWGNYAEGQTEVPAGLTGVTAIAAGVNHSLALKSDGTVVAWGDDSEGESDVPAGLNGVVAIAAGNGQSLALKSDGTVVAWGNGSNGMSAIPAGLCGGVAIAAGDGFDVALAPLFSPVITSQPVNQVVTQGGSATFSVTAIGDTLCYQWLKNGKPITGATNSTLTLNSIYTGDVGKYSVAISNVTGFTTSVAASLSLWATYNSAVLSVPVGPTGGLSGFAYFEYGTDTRYGRKTAAAPLSGTATLSLDMPVTGLKPNTTYHYRLVSVIAGVMTYGPDEIFTTPGQSPVVPDKTTVTASYQSCAINGTVFPNGLATSYYFEYGTGGCYANRTTITAAGRGVDAVPVRIYISGLTPGTDYNGRLVALNVSGTTHDTGHVFTTATVAITPVALNGIAANPIINDNGVVAATVASGAQFGIGNHTGIIVNSGSTPQLIAYVTGSAPFTGGSGSGVFASLGAPVLNNQDEVAFFGTLRTGVNGVTEGNASGIWKSVAGMLSPVIRAGDSVPISGATAKLASLTQFALTDAGVIFAGKLAPQKNAVTAATDEGIWITGSDGQTSLVSRTGDSWFGDSPATVTHYYTFDTPEYVAGQTRSFDRTGDFIMKVGFNDKSVGIYGLGNVNPFIPFQGGAAPGITDGGFLDQSISATYTGFGTSAISGSGSAFAFKATVTGSSVGAANNTGIWLASGTDSWANPELVARTWRAPAPLRNGVAYFESIPGSVVAPLENGTANGIFATLSDPVINDSSEVAFLGTLHIGQAGASNDSGTWVITYGIGQSGITPSNNTGIWVFSSGSLSLAARTGIQAPDCPDGVVFSKFLQFALPDQGGVVLLANLAGTGVTNANNQGIWAVDTAGSLRLIVRKGDLQPLNSATGTISALSILDPATGTLGQTRSFNSEGDLIYKATFHGNATGVYKVIFP